MSMRNEEEHMAWGLKWLEGRQVSLTEDEVRELLEAVRAENDAHDAWEAQRRRTDKVRARVLMSALDRVGAA